MAGQLNNLASLLLATNHHVEAEALMRRAIAISEQSLGSDRSDMAIYLNNLAQLLQHTGRLSEAEVIIRRNLAILELCSSDWVPRTGTGM